MSQLVHLSILMDYRTKGNRKRIECACSMCVKQVLFSMEVYFKNVDLQGRETGFHRGVEGAFSTEILYKTNVPLNGQTRREISSPQPVDMPSAQPLIDSLMNPPDLAVEPPSSHGFNGSLSLLFSLLLFASVLVG